MADLKISDFDNGGAVQDGDALAAVRDGVNVKVFVGTAAAKDAGNNIGDMVEFIDDGSGQPALPAASGKNLIDIDPSSIGDGTVSESEFSMLQGVTNPIQSQLEGKLNKTSALTYPLMNYGGYKFDGANDYLDGHPMNGVADGKVFSCVIDVRHANPASVSENYMANQSTRFMMERNAAGKVRLFARNSSGTTILDVATTDNVIAAAGVYNIQASVDLTNIASAKIIVNDVSRAVTVTTLTNDNIDFTTGEFAIGANAAGSNKISGDLYRVWLDLSANLDFTSETVRRKFSDANSVPVFLGISGELPTGSIPSLFLGYDSGAAWAVNKGSALGTFVINGASVAPTTPIYGQYVPRSQYATTSSASGSSVVQNVDLKANFKYELTLNQVSMSAAANLAFEASADGTTYATTTYESKRITAATPTDQTTNLGRIVNASDTLIGKIELWQPVLSGPLLFKATIGTMGGDIIQETVGSCAVTAPVTKIRLIDVAATATFDSGSVSLRSMGAR